MQDGQREFEAFINSIPELAWVATPEGEVYWYNERFFEYTGTSADELKKSGWGVVHDPKLLPEILKIWHHSIETGTPFERVMPLRGRDRKFRWFLSRTWPVKDENGSVTRWVGTATDVDTQTQFQRQLIDTIDTMSDTFLAIDKDWKIIRVNSVLLRETGFTPDQVVGRDFRDVFLSAPEAKETKYWTEYHRLMKDRVPVQFEEYYEPYDMWTATRAYPTSEGGFTIFSNDITERKRNEKAMREAKEVAERANALKSAFLANMSHEIRTPLGAMLGFTDLLKDPSLSPEERERYLDILTRNGEQLSYIINDILDLSKVEAGQLTLEYLPTSPESIANEVISLWRLKAQEKGLELSYSNDISTPRHAISDPLRVRQVLMNLVNNAVKFTANGSVKISSSSFTNERGRRIVVFDVIDTGMGIDQAQREDVFGAFVQADGSMTRRFGGTGLGLALSRMLARSLGGDVVLTASKQNEGSTFEFSFEDRPEKVVPVGRRVPSPKSFGAAEKPLDHIKVLVVDDSPDNQTMIARFLTKAGAQVESAENGLEGSDMAIAKGFDVVLMDVQMPVMDGYAASRRLRDLGFRRPIIALTAHALNEVRDRALEAGCTDHLSKPINANSLVAAVAKYAAVH